MKKLICVILLTLLFKLSYPQIEDVPIDNSESPGSFDKMAITTSLKSAYPLAVWLNDFDKYISNKKDIKSLSEVSTGFYHILMKSYCVRPGVPVGGTGSGTVLGPMKGKKSKVIREVIFRAVKHPEIEQKYVQTLIWGIIAGIAYDDYPKDFRKKIDPLLSASEKKESGIKFNDLLNLIPDELKGQLGVFNDIGNLVREGINRFEELERVAVPQGTPIPSSKDMNIEPGQWTLFENGYYIRANPIVYDNTPVEIYKPEMVRVGFDSQGRINELESSLGKVECEYDDGEGADVIARGGEHFKINRIKMMKLDGKDLEQFKDALWTIPFDYKTSSTSGYSRIFDPPLGIYEKREKDAADFIDAVKKYNKKQKLSIKDSDILSLYDLKQFELCIKMMADFAMLPGEDIDRLIRITMDATSNKIGDVAYKNKLSSGGETGSGPEIGGLVVMFGADGSQNTVISPEDQEKIPSVFLHNVNCDVLPGLDVMYTARLEVLNNDRPIQEIVIDLYDISREKGRYLNDKEQRDNVDADMIFNPEGCPGYTITQGGGVPNWFIARGNGSSPLQVTIKCRDYGAFAKLKATVKIDGITYNAIADGFGTHLNIPCDDNNNHIADKWENDNGVSGLPADWDEEDNPAGQEKNGDGITLYEEYRGFYELLPSGYYAHVRTDPKKKDLFVIDNDNIFSVYTFERASGINAYRLDHNLVYGSIAGDMVKNPDFRWVDFCRGYSAGVKYAINLIKIKGIDDPYHLCTDTVEYDGCSTESAPINVNLTIVLPERTRTYLENERTDLQAIYDANPTATEYTIGNGYVLLRSDMLAYLEVFNNPPKFNLLLDFVRNYVVIHEIGHAVSISHHIPENVGSIICPMRYTDLFDDVGLFDARTREIINSLASGDNTIFIAYGFWRFCTENNCWSQINVNDRLP